MDFRVETGDRDGTFVISLYGEFDLAAAESLPDWASSVKGRSNVEVDMTGLTFMDSSGLREILKLRDNVESRGDALALRIVPGSEVERVFEITGLIPWFTVVSD